MNLSQLSHISLFSRPAARYTNKDRLLYSTTSTSGGRFAPVTPAGFTLVEVLVAMVILLVGIWALAVAFPKLLGVVATQEKHTEMAQQAERTLNQLTRYPQDLPLAIRGDSRLPDANDPTNRGPEGIPATGSPDDPSITDFAITHANARDDMIEIIGERFTVPAPSPGGAPTPVYAFRQGLATLGTVVVYNEQPLPSGFSVAPDGTVNFPLGVNQVEINYDWVESGASGATHHVYRELIPNSVTQVAAASVGSFGRVLPGTVEGIELYPLAVLPGGGPPGTDEVVEDPSGAMLLFNANRAGDRMRISYVLLTDPGRHDRRALIMCEEHRIVSLPQTITLVASHIDETPLPVDIDGTGSFDDGPILAVNVGNGELYWEGNGLELADAAKGEVTLPLGSAAASAIGSELQQRGKSRCPSVRLPRLPSVLSSASITQHLTRT